MPSFGLTFLSRAALRQAEQLMLAENAGVRDEVGFLIVHQRYSDRFFPGTSVLHTRLRYSLFVPWLIDRLRAEGLKGMSFAAAMQREEIKLTERLLDQPFGVIGKLVHPEASSQPPSYVYWTALSRWGLISLRPDRRPYGRSDFGPLINSSRERHLKDDDGRPITAAAWPIAELPSPPPNWDEDSPLSFNLTQKEIDFLATALRALRCQTDPTEPSLLSRLVGRSVAGAGTCWDDQILGYAGPHRAALRRSGRAAALAAIGRGVYAALVEQQKERDGRTASNQHRNSLEELLEVWSDEASGLDHSLLLKDLGTGLPPSVSDVMRDTLSWVQRGAGNPVELLQTYRRAEVRRKGVRARLAEAQRGIDRRIEWNGDNHPSAVPLHYRWDRVQLMLQDLVGA